MNPLFPTSVILDDTFFDHFIDAHSQYKKYEDTWIIIRDCIEGQAAIKNKREFYLPKAGDLTTNSEYQAYLDRAVFYNMSRKTVNGLVGMVFRKPPNVDGLVDKTLLKKVTRDGQSLNSFLRSIVTELLSVGRYGVLLDLPRDGGTPYFAGYKAEQIRNWRTAVIDGRVVLEQVVLAEYETSIPEDGFGTETNLIYRVLELRNGIYSQRVIKSKDDEGTVIVPEVDGQHLNYIPFQFFNQTNLKPDVENPPMSDIAFLNISLYQSSAELEQGRFYTAIPIYVVSGAAGDDNPTYKVGHNVVWQIGAEDKAQILEYRGQGLTSLENAVETKERQIQALGGKILSQSRRAAAESTEAVLLREKGEQDLLLSVTNTVSEGMSYLLALYLTWSGESFDASRLNVELNQDFEGTKLAGRDLRVLQQLYTAKMLPLNTYFGIMKQAGLVDSSVSVEEFTDMLNDPEQFPNLPETEG